MVLNFVLTGLGPKMTKQQTQELAKTVNESLQRQLSMLNTVDYNGEKMIKHEEASLMLKAAANNFAMILELTEFTEE